MILIRPHLVKRRGWWCMDRNNHIRYGGPTITEAYKHWKSQHCSQCQILTAFPLLLVGVGKFCSRDCINKYRDANSNRTRDQHDG
jgi:hypothetical protein